MPGPNEGTGGPGPELAALLAARDRAQRIGGRPLRTVGQLSAWVNDRQVVLVSGAGSLPCATAAIAGRPIAGSWWGDRAGHLIYRLLTELEEDGHEPIELCSLVGGKQTYVAGVARRALSEVASDAGRRRRALDRLPTGARRLLSQLADGPVTAPDRPSRVALEAALLATTRSVHTEAGRHVAVCGSSGEDAGDSSQGGENRYVAALADLLRACLRSAVAAPERDLVGWLRRVEPDRARIEAAAALLELRRLTVERATWVTLE